MCYEVARSVLFNKQVTLTSLNKQVITLTVLNSFDILLDFL